eukprot:gene4940-6179_t
MYQEHAERILRLLHKSPQRGVITAAEATEALALLERIASPRGFYEQLALEELGRKITAPERPQPLTAEEKEAA